jgi:hypothetical protein
MNYTEDGIPVYIIPYNEKHEQSNQTWEQQYEYGSIDPNRWATIMDEFDTSRKIDSGELDADEYGRTLTEAFDQDYDFISANMGWD